MKRELRDKWCEALRSGDYRQGTDNLRDDDGYCCLGVLAVVAGFDVDKLYDEATLPDNTLLTDEMSEAVGLEPVPHVAFGVDHYYRVPSDHIQKQLAELNFNDGLSFDGIANWIEANLPVEE